jgi:2-oxoglutarate ferredoxin oxidoreductase subunit alpha
MLEIRGHRECAARLADTGLPTKTEQADLLQALYGRNGECPIPWWPPVAARCSTPRSEAVRIAPASDAVLLLTDGYLANGRSRADPDIDSLPDLRVSFPPNPTPPPPTAHGLHPYLRDPDTLACRGGCRAPRA